MSDKIILKGAFQKFEAGRYRQFGYRTYIQAMRIRKINKIFRAK